MSDYMVVCSSCGVNNRIPEGSDIALAKCGKCKKRLNRLANKSCQLCSDEIAQGVILLNGEVIHQSCLDRLTKKQGALSRETYKVEVELKNLNQ